MNAKQKRIKRKKIRKIHKIICLLLFIISLIFCSTLIYLNILPLKYIILILAIIFILNFILLLSNFSKKKIVRLLAAFLSICLMGVQIYGEVYLYNTIGFLTRFSNGNYNLKNYNILVLKESNYSKIDDLDNKNIGVKNNDDSVVKVLEEIDKKIDFTTTNYDDIVELTNNLINNKNDAIILEESELSLIQEEHNDLFLKLKKIYTKEIKIDIENAKETEDINKDSFNIYISGIDTYGKIQSISRSDVNIILTVNPTKEKMLITWIPRDYYVTLDKINEKDKLTHSGIYGIDNSINTIENLLDIDINYYVRVNFSSMIKIVNTLGGIDVINDEDFSTDEGLHFKKGSIHLNGDKALAYVRERYHLKDGDEGRGRHQIIVLNALLKKFMSSDTIKNYNNILNSLDGAFTTNMGQSTMTSFIKREISKPRNWQIDSERLTGTNAMEYTYSMKNTKLYVMIPDNDSVSSAISKIKDIQDK